MNSSLNQSLCICTHELYIFNQTNRLNSFIAVNSAQY